MAYRYIWAVLGLVAAAAPAQTSPLPYALDQRYATIGFTTTGLGAVQGYFTQFSGHLTLDFAAPQNSRVDVTVNDAAFSLSLPFAVSMLRGPAYFDAQDFPQISFHSVSVQVKDATHFELLGLLTMRGVTQPLDMQAVLRRRSSSNVADFYVTGSVSRAAFGMVADRGVVDDMVSLQIHARVTLAP